MFIRKVGPIWAPDGEGAGGAGTEGAGAGGAGAAGGEGAGTQNAGGDGGAGTGGSGEGAAGDAFAVLDEGTRDWLQTKGYKDVSALATAAQNQEKLLGNAVRIPGKDATPEEREAFLNKLGRPEKADAYAYSVPKDLPEGLPYDGEKANAFKALSHKLGLTQEQSAALHDFYVGEQVGAFKGMSEQQAAQLTAKGEAATEALVKEWGPLDGDTFRANVEIADKVFTQLPGGPELLAELKSLGLVGPNKEVLSVPLAKAFAALGTALYTEDGVLRGKPDVVGNPFDKKAASFNLTAAMKVAKEDPDRARSLITAAGLKPEEFGLK